MSAPVAALPFRCWFVMAQRWGSGWRYLLHQTLDLAEARWAKAAAQSWLDRWLPQQCWLVSLYTLAEVR